jgi:pre-mRNA-splicing factor CDC5/CEF1
MTYFPDDKKFALRSQNSNSANIAALQHELNVLRNTMKTEAKKAQTAEKKIAIYHGGYMKRAETLRKTIDNLYDEISQARRELESYKMIRNIEQNAIPARIEVINHF